MKKIVVLGEGPVVVEKVFGVIWDIGSGMASARACCSSLCEVPSRYYRSRNRVSN